MVLFKRSLAKKLHKGEWIYWLDDEDGNISSNYFNIGFRDTAPINNKRNLCCFSIKLLTVSKNNDRISFIDIGKLKEVEEDIIRSLKRTTNLYFATIATAKTINIYFYSRHSFLRNEFKAIINKFRNHKIVFSVKEELNWDTYFELLDHFSLSNKRKDAEIVEDIQPNDETDQNATENHHWISFKNKNDLTNFLNELHPIKFKILSQYFDADAQLYNLELKLTEKTILDKNNLMVLLWHLANKNEGKYDGCEVARK